MDPVEMHAHGFRFVLLNTTVGESNGCGIANINGGGGMGVVHFNDRCLDGNGFLPFQKQGFVFGFSGGGYDIAQYFAQDKDETVEHWGLIRNVRALGLGSLRKKIPMSRLRDLET